MAHIELIRFAGQPQHLKIGQPNDPQPASDQEHGQHDILLKPPAQKQKTNPSDGGRQKHIAIIPGKGRADEITRARFGQIDEDQRGHDGAKKHHPAEECCQAQLGEDAPSLIHEVRPFSHKHVPVSWAGCRRTDRTARR